MPPNVVWTGNAETLGAEFNVSENETRETFSDLSDRRFLEKLVPGKVAIVNWSERDEAAASQKASGNV